MLTDGGLLEKGFSAGKLLSHTLRMSHALEPAESRLSAPAWTLLGRDPRALLPPPPSSAPSTSTARTLHETAPSGPLARLKRA